MTDWFALVDAARDPRLYGLIQRCRDHQNLFAGTIDPSLAAASPYLVRLDESEPLLAAWRAEGAGGYWGILVESLLPLAELRRLFRRFLQVRLPDGEVVMFRFFDPRIFATYLPASPPGQVPQWFDGVVQYVLEDENGDQHQFRWRRGRLHDGDQPIGG